MEDTTSSNCLPWVGIGTKKSQELLKFNSWSKLLSQAVSPAQVLLCLQLTCSVTPGFILGPGRIKLKVWMLEPHFSLQQAMLRHNELPTTAAPAAHLGRGGRAGLSSESSPQALNTVCYERAEQLGSHSTTAHSESPKEHFSPKDHPKSTCFSWKMPLKLLHSFLHALSTICFTIGLQSLF